MSSRLMRHTPGTVVPLQQNHPHKFALDYAVSLYARNAIFTFIPKNGCTSLRYSAALDNQVISDLTQLDWIHKNNASFRPTHRDLVTATYTFVVLRCPFQRLVSCFLDKIVADPSLVRPLQARALARRLVREGRMATRVARLLQRTGANPAARPDITFADFVSLLEMPGALSLDIHWQPQADFLIYRSYDDVFRLEDMAHAQTTVQAKAGFTVHDTRAITGHGNSGRDWIRDGFFGRTDTRTLRKLKNDMKVPAYDLFYDAELYRRVSRLYQSDIQLYAGHFGQSALLQQH